MFKHSFCYTRIFILFLAGVLWVAAPAGQGLAQPSEKELFLVAQKAFEDGFYDVAMRYIQQLQEQFPQTDRRVESNLLLGQCYFFKGQYLKAYNIFHDLLKESAFKDATLFWLGETYLKGGDYAQSEEQYNQLIKLYGDSIYTPQAYYSLGWVAFEQNQFEKAQKAFLALIQKFPTHQLAEEAYFKIGEIAFQREQYKESIGYFTDYIGRYPQSTHQAEAYFYMGESAYYLEDFLTAVTYYAKAEELAYDYKLTLMAKVSLGWSYLKLEKFKLAQQYFDQAYSYAREKGILSDDVLLGRASLYSAMGEYQEALKSYAELVEKFPASKKLSDAYLGQANIYYLREDYGNAIDSYQGIINQFAARKDYADILEKAYFGLAWSYLKRGNIDESIKNFELIKNAATNKTVKISALTQIGDAYQDIGQLEKAVEVYDEILRDYPESPYTDYVQYRQGIALLKNEKIDAATLSLRSLKSNFPQSKYLSDADYYLALAYFKKGDWKAARDQTTQFIGAVPKENPFLAEAHYILGLSCFNLQDYANALKTFQVIIKDYPAETTMIKNVEMTMAKCYYKIGDVKEATKRFTNLIAAYPKTAVAQEAIIWLGDYYLESAAYDTAITYYQQFMESFPGSPKLSLVLYELGQAYQAKEEYDQAVGAYKRVNDPVDGGLNTKARMAIADIFSRELDSASALETYQDIIKVSPEFRRDAFIKMAEVYRKNQDHAKAIEAYQNALSAPKGFGEIKDAELQFAVGDLYELSNQPDKAVEEYLKIAYLYPKETSWIVKAYLRAGRIFEDSEKWDDAKTVYQKIIQYKTEELKFARERMDWINEHILRQ